MIEFLFPRRFRQWLGPLLVIGGAAIVLAILLIVSGLFQFPASEPDPQGVARLVHFTFGRSVAHHAARIEAPADLGAEWRVMAGAGHYARVCSSCHGAPGLGQNPIALSMRPRPQYLPNVVDQYSPPELFWIVKHGVKFSGMPAWPAVRRDDEVWSVVAFLERMTKIGPHAYRRLAYGNDLPALDPARLFGPATTHQGYALRNAAEPPHDEFAYVAPAMGLQDSALIGDPLPNCAGCHGADGAGRAGGAFPNLAIQDPRYLKASLTAYASGQRFSGIMQTVASQLSPRQIDALAGYYAAQPRRQANRTPQQPALIAEGERLVNGGASDGKVGACGGCHGVEGASPQAIPRLSGQNPIYFAEQMKLFRAGGRGHSGGYNPMNAASHKLTDRQIAAVSVYYAARMPSAANGAPAAVAR